MKAPGHACPGGCSSLGVPGRRGTFIGCRVQRFGVVEGFIGLRVAFVFGISGFAVECFAGLRV